ncbi:DUF835 domain-containing protein [Palaeococcus ferrophilus]|uniref:DUF835 domain-containing protein n=1 Tax=Palaeococcus ferrophilus TaxID=83868 RepID=UPI000ADE9D55|nr:DUF835 domain-containing protein [Palaeococcus ferrophilus]
MQGYVGLLIMAGELLIFVGIALMIVLSYSFRPRFIMRYPELKRGYDMIIASFILILAGEIIYAYTVLSGINETLDALSQGLYLLSIGLFIYGWWRILRATAKGGLRELLSKDTTGNGDWEPGVHLLNPKEATTAMGRIKGEKLIVTRDPTKFGEFNNIYWLTKVETERSIAPNRLEYLQYVLTTFMNASKEPNVILLDGIEYLVLENGFNATFKLLTALHDAALLTNTRILLPVDEDSLEEKHMAMLKREFLKFPA